MTGLESKNEDASILKDYFAKYLTEVRNLSESSVKHYFDALNNISRRIKEKGLVQKDIYEIADLDRLEYVRSILYKDPDFISLDRRGGRMYSAGLNNYCNFATGTDFHSIRDRMGLLDMPVKPEAAVVIEETVWKRSGIIRTQAIEIAGYKCEINPAHQSFIAEKTHKPYMEGHHALPINCQERFNVSLDVYANIVCLCPVCHRQIHHGLRENRIDMIRQIYDARSTRLAKSGISLSQDEFVDTVIAL